MARWVRSNVRWRSEYVGKACSSIPGTKFLRNYFPDLKVGFGLFGVVWGNSSHIIFPVFPCLQSCCYFMSTAWM